MAGMDACRNRLCRCAIGVCVLISVVGAVVLCGLMIRPEVYAGVPTIIMLAAISMLLAPPATLLAARTILPQREFARDA